MNTKASSALSTALDIVPISAIMPDILQAISTHSQVILQAPTGAGKSTALPLSILQSRLINGKVLMLEPRRVATRNVAKFIAKQLGQDVGEDVGYRIRGESKCGPNTQLEVITEGMLTRMIQQDPELTGIDLIIFDEIHERHITTDMGLALALEVQQSLRDDLTILAMSATLAELPLQSLMPDAITLMSEGRSFPVDVSYSPVPSQMPWLQHMARVIVEAMTSQSDDNDAQSLLAFLPGKGEIRALASMLEGKLSNSVNICPLYGELDNQAQDKAIAPPPLGQRKVVLATNVAESSLTIEGIAMVVDSGYQRIAMYNPKTGVSKLAMNRISQASAVQRTGRAGRLAKGKSIRLWSAEEQGRLQSSSLPEITLTELVSCVFDSANWGVKSLAELNLLTPAPKVNEQMAWALLQQLSLVDTERKITPMGRDAYALNCHPRLAYMLLKAKELSQQDNDYGHYGALACLLAGIIEARGLPNFGADISRYLVYATKGEIKKQVTQWLKRLNIHGDLSLCIEQTSDKDIGHLLALAFPDRIAKARGQQGFLLANGTGVVVDEADPLALATWLVVTDFQEIQGKRAGKVYLASHFEPRLLDNELNHLVTEQRKQGFDEQKGRFYVEQQSRLGDIVLASKADNSVNQDDIKQALLAWVKQKGLGVLAFDDEAKQLQNRVMLAAFFDEHASEPWPDFSDDMLLENLEDWLEPYLTGVNSLAMLSKLNIAKLLYQSLPWSAQQALNTLVPTHWPMATGTNAPIRYELPLDDQGKAFIQQHKVRALLSVRLQEAYGLAASPVLINGNLIVTMELLSPARRPLATTADLASFWQGPYVEVKKEMRGRYPKHLWPDDPANTNATKFTKKKTLGL